LLTGEQVKRSLTERQLSAARSASACFWAAASPFNSPGRE